MHTNESFGNLIYSARTRLGISMQNAALDMGLSKTVLWNLEHGFACNPTAKTLNAIRKLYYLSPKQLLNALDK